MKAWSWIRPGTRARARYLLVMLMFAATFAVFDLSNWREGEAAAGDGSWSSGDRLANANHLSSGWKQIELFGPAGESRSWSPAIASTPDRTVTLWGKSQAAPLVGFQWFPSHGTWIKDGSFFTKPLPFDSVKSAPALVQRRHSLLDVVVLGKDQYYHAFHPGNSWSNWEGLGLPNGLVGGSPAITASKAGMEEIDVWVIAKGTLFRKHWQQSTSWQAWTPIGFPAGVSLIGSPGATTRSDNTIDIVAAGQDGQLFHAHFNSAGAFAGWETIPGKSFTQPSVISRAPDNLEVWVKGATDGRIFHEVWSPATNWQPFEFTINEVPNGPEQTFTSGPAVNVNSGVTTVAAVNDQGAVMARSWVDKVKPEPSTTPEFVEIRRPRNSLHNFVQERCAENTVVMAPNCEKVFVSLGCSGVLRRQNMNCVLNGTGQVLDKSFKSCDSVLSKDVTGSKSTDNYVNVLKDGKVLLLRQVGGVTTVTARTDQTVGTCRGVEHIYFGSSCGTNWEGPIVLDPCDPNGPFDASFCNTGARAILVPTGGVTCPSDPTGTDRPQVFTSRHDGSVFIALGVTGLKKNNLVLLRSHQSNLFSWQAMDTELVSTGGTGAVAMSETPTHLYLARCEYDNPANVGLYSYQKDQDFIAKRLVFVGNIHVPSCSNGNVVMSLMRSKAGYPVVRWVIPATDSSGKQFIKRGFSALTPAGLVTLQTDELKSGKMIGLPTLVARDFKNRALLYWYELGSDDKWRVKAATSDGIGRWSASFTMSTAAWAKVGEPWNLSTLPTPPHDYMTGDLIEQGSSTKFLAQWIQPVGSNNEVFYGIVNW